MDSPVVLRSLEMGLANEDAHDGLLLQAELGDTDPEYVLRVDLHRVNVGEVSQCLGVTQPRDTGRMIEFAIAAVDANPLSTAFWVRDTLRTFKFTGAGLWFTTPKDKDIRLRVYPDNRVVIARLAYSFEPQELTTLHAALHHRLLITSPPFVVLKSDEIECTLEQPANADELLLMCHRIAHHVYTDL